MKININEEEIYEIKSEELTYQEFLKLYDRIVAIANPIHSSNISPVSVPISSSTPDESLGRKILELRRGGAEFNDIADRFRITAKEARILYLKFYNRDYQKKLWNERKKKGWKGWKKKKEGKVKVNLTKEGKMRKRASPKVRWTDREEVLKLIRIHFKGTDEDKEKFARSKGMEWGSLIKVISHLIKRFNIKPYEIGVSELRKKMGRKPQDESGKRRGRPPKQRTEIEKIEKPAQLEPSEMKDILNDVDLTPTEESFVKFFEIYQKTPIAEPLVKKAVLLLRDYLKQEKGLQGNTEDILSFLYSHFKSMRPIISPENLDRWLA